MSDPYTSPGLYDFHTLDGIVHPGVSWVESRGERNEEFQDQQVPLTRGASTVFRFEPNGEISYTVKLWKAAHFDAWAPFVAMLNEGKNRYPKPRVYVLADARLEDVQMTSVGFKGMGPRMVKRGGETLIKVSYKEVRKQKPYGGVAPPADDPRFKSEVARLDAERKDLTGKIDAARAAARAGK